MANTVIEGDIGWAGGEMDLGIDIGIDQGGRIDCAIILRGVAVAIQ